MTIFIWQVGTALKAADDRRRISGTHCHPPLRSYAKVVGNGRGRNLQFAEKAQKIAGIDRVAVHLKRDGLHPGIYSSLVVPKLFLDCVAYTFGKGYTEGPGIVI